MSETVAMEGFDPVAYQTEGQLRKGSETHEHDWHGKTWLFASEANRRVFVEDPERYAPEYGGGCAFAASLGKQVPGSPRHWKIVDGRLFLQANPVAGLLFRLIPGRIRAADEKWTSGQLRS